jgi:prevent-host-death family protein
VNAHEFRNRFGWYLERAAAGEVFQVTRHGKPFVKVSPALVAPSFDDLNDPPD